MHKTAFLSLILLCVFTANLPAQDVQITDNPDVLRIETPELRAAINKRGYVTGVMRQSFVDRQTGFHDPGYGLDIVDWIMEPGSDETYRDQLDPELVYPIGNAYHGNTPKRCLEGPQVCTQAKEMQPVIVRGSDFTAIRQQFHYRTAAPGKVTGSLWTQWIVFPAGKRYFISMDRIDAVNDSDAMFLRIDMPGHVKHTHGDTFESVYLSYLGELPRTEFFEDFAPDEKFNYRRDTNETPERMIRAVRLRDPQTAEPGPWLAGMTLDPSIVSEAWCHQRGYICMIEEFGGRPVKAGESFSAAFIVGYFDSIAEMELVYDRHKGRTSLEVTPDGWELK